MIMKPEHEAEAVQKTLDLNREAYNAIRNGFRRGMNEVDVHMLLSSAYNLKAGRPVEFICDLVSGERAAAIGGTPSPRVLRDGDTMIVDALPQLGGYWCDTTRTYFIGKPDEEKQRAYNSIIKAIRAGEAALKPGVMAEEVYAAVLKSLEESGYSGCMPHHAGHGFGTTTYERPYFIKNSPERLQEGMLVTLEPGIYIDGQWGIRVENDYEITKDGFVNIFNYTEKLEDFIL